MITAPRELTTLTADRSPRAMPTRARRPSGRGRRQGALLASALVLLMATPTASDAGGRPRPFAAAIVGQSTVSPTSDGCVLSVTEAGTGVALHLGKTAWAATESLNLCVEPGRAHAQADFVMTAADGDEIFGRYVSVVRLDRQTGAFTFVGRWQVAGGTGRFQHAAGDGTLIGRGQMTSPSAAELAGSFVGTISY